MSGDIDEDGDLDLVITNCNGAVRILRNEHAAPGHWLQVRAIDPELNRDAVGARIEITAAGRRQVRVVSHISSYLVGSDATVHFGLGDAEQVDQMLVRWPDGAEQEVRGLEVDRKIVVTRDTGSRIPSR